MGKKFKLSDIIPNAWFYKFKYMNKTSNTTQSSNSSILKKDHLSPPPAPPSSPPQPELECRSRKSYHITRELTIDLIKSPPRKSKSSSKSRRSTRRSSSISSFSCHSTSTSLSFGSKSRSPPSPPPPRETDVIKTIDNVGFLVEDDLLKYKANYIPYKQNILDKNVLADNNKPEHFDRFLVEDARLNINKAGHTINKNAVTDYRMQPEHFQLPPPIITTKKETQPKKFFKEQKQNPQTTPSRRLSISSLGGVRLKINSPRFIGKKQGQDGHGHKNIDRKSGSLKKRRSISESFAIVKSSFNPQRDFEESMVEMIVQNNLTAAKDLEDLLACYLSLNSDEYHHIIIKVFKQIWFDFSSRNN